MRDVLPALPDEAIERFRAVVESDTLYNAGEVEYGDERIAPSVFSVKAFPLAGRRMAITFENVTENVRARRALQESESRFRGAFHSASVGMALTALDGTFVQVNDRLAEMLGYPVEELMRLGVRGITHPDDLSVDFENAIALKSGEIESYHREKRYLRKDGSVVWADLTVSLVRTYDDEPTHVVSHIQDITDRKEAALLFAAIFEHSVVPKLIADDQRCLVDVNEAAADLLGISREAALGLRLDDLMPDEAVARMWPRFLKHGTIDAEVTLHRPGRRHATHRVRRDGKRAAGPAYLRRPRPLAPEGPRGAAAPGAEDGGGRAARRRDRPRLQQPAHRDPRLQRVPDRRPRR